MSKGEKHLQAWQRGRTVGQAAAYESVVRWLTMGVEPAIVHARCLLLLQSLDPESS
ncbi:MAG: hypothetical protein V3T26_05930 [candidate division NC10 bacterium]